MKPMTSEEEAYAHLEQCCFDLNDCWRVLREVQGNARGPLAGVAFKYAVIAYSRPWRSSRGITRRSLVAESKLVPEEWQSLHQRLLDRRDQVVAHSDLTVREPNVYVAPTASGRAVGVVQNVVTGTEEFAEIDQFIALVEGTLLRLYRELELRKAELPFNQ